MTNILILADHEAGKVAKTAAELATFAKRGGSPLAVLLAPAGQADALGSQLANTEIEKVIAVESDDFARHGIAAMVDALAQIIESQKPSAVLIASSARGKEIAGRLAVRINSGVITDAIDLAADLGATQSIFGGSFTVSSRVKTGIPVITLRPSAIEPAATSQTPAIEKVSITISEKAKLVTISNTQPAVKGGRPELTEAKIVISGGRGTNGDFTQVEAMADLLGAAVGASRAATDAGSRAGRGAGRPARCAGGVGLGPDRAGDAQRAGCGGASTAPEAGPVGLQRASVQHQRCGLLAGTSGRCPWGRRCVSRGPPCGRYEQPCLVKRPVWPCAWRWVLRSRSHPRRLWWSAFRPCSPSALIT